MMQHHKIGSAKQTTGLIHALNLNSKNIIYVTSFLLWMLIKTVNFGKIRNSDTYALSKLKCFKKTKSQNWFKNGRARINEGMAEEWRSIIR